MSSLLIAIFPFLLLLVQQHTVMADQSGDQKNILGETLKPCSMNPLTGWTRSGYCENYNADRGVHSVCAQMTDYFLSFTRAMGNDLSTPAPQYNFPGLKPGDRWCLCAARWQEAFAAQKAPRVVPDATHEVAAKFANKSDLMAMDVKAVVATNNTNSSPKDEF